MKRLLEERIRLGAGKGLLHAMLGFVLATSPAWAETFGVNESNDLGDIFPGDGDCWTGGYVSTGMFGQKACSLRAAIQEANALLGADQITFSSALSLDSFGTIVLSPNAPLPSISDPLTIDGTSAPGYDGMDPNPIPVVVLSGDQLIWNPNHHGLELLENADDSVIEGLSIVHFGGNGIWVHGADGVRIDANHIGLYRGDIVSGNGGRGIVVEDTSGWTTIGSRFDSALGFVGPGNVVSGNQYTGILIYGQNTRVSANRVGTDRFGNVVENAAQGFGNRAYGITVTGALATNAEIGRVATLINGTEVASGNAVSGNTSAGVVISGDASDAKILANHIGIGLDGITPLGNGTGPGVLVSDGIIGVQVGQLGLGGNIISGNYDDGVQIGNGSMNKVQSPSVIGNRIGLNAAGDALVENRLIGIRLDGVLDAQILDNEVGGGQIGIQLNADRTQVFRNYVGTNAAGLDLAVFGYGISNLGRLNEIGRDRDTGNVLGFNRRGIYNDREAYFALIRGNMIGTDSLGRDFGNEVGVSLDGVGATLGGPLPEHANTIGMNTGEGVGLSAGTSQNQIMGNFIGTNANGAQLGNGATGITVLQGSRSTIGSDSSTPASEIDSRRNIIAFNGQHGILLREVLQNSFGETVGISMRGNSFRDNGGNAIDLDRSGDYADDPGDADLGPNLRQNSPEIDAAFTDLDSNTGELSIRYSVDSSQANSAYPMTIDFYQVAEDGEEPGTWLGSDVYLGVDAQLDRDVILTPSTPLPGAYSVVAIATDDDENTSEAGNLVAVPEPAFGTSLFGGLIVLGGSARIKRDVSCWRRM